MFATRNTPQKGFFYALWGFQQIIKSFSKNMLENLIN